MKSADLRRRRPVSTTMLLVLLTAGAALAAVAGLSRGPTRIGSAAPPSGAAPTASPVARAEDYFNAQEVDLGRRHASDGRLVLGVRLAVQVGVLVLLLCSQAGFQLRLWSAVEAQGRPWLMAALMALGTALLWAMALVPLDFYGGFVLQHRYGLATQSLSSWLLDWLLDRATWSGLFVAATVLVYCCIPRWPCGWWLPVGVLVAAAGVSL